jgi:hypothetical protein
VIIPTIGRATLAAAMDSCAGAKQVIVMTDQHQTPGDVGYTARRKAMAFATGTHLAFLDDDDEYLPGAIAAFREAACDVPVIFRVDHPMLGVNGNVSTQMFLVPNDPARLGEWAAHVDGRGGDYTFIRGCVDRMGAPVWNDEVVARLSPAGVAAGSHVTGVRA